MRANKRQRVIGLVMCYLFVTNYPVFLKFYIALYFEQP